MSNDASASLSDILATAMEAERVGVPVDWKEMTMRVYNAASNYIASIEDADDPNTTESDAHSQQD